MYVLKTGGKKGKKKFISWTAPSRNTVTSSLICEHMWKPENLKFKGSKEKLFKYFHAVLLKTIALD